MMLGGCPTPTQAWFLLVPLVAYNLIALWLVSHPDRIRNEWPFLVKKLFALGMVTLGTLLGVLMIHTAITGQCLGIVSISY